MNERLKELRKSLRLSQSEFGTKLGVGNTAISKIENGERGLTDTLIKLICTEFEVSESWLRTGEGEMFPNLEESDKLANLIGRMMKENSISGDKAMVEILINLFKIKEIASDDQWSLVKKTIKNWAKEEKEE